MAEKQQPSFSIDDFIGEIEKAEAEQLNKRLPQERLRNKRQLDNAARRAAEKAGDTGKLVAQPLIRKSEAVSSVSSQVSSILDPSISVSGEVSVSAEVSISAP